MIPVRSRSPRLAPAAAVLGLIASIAWPTPVEAAERAERADAHGPREGYERSPLALRLGLSSGLALPFGKAYGNSDDLADVVRATVPLGVEAGLRIDPRFYVGFVGQVGLVLPNDCPTHVRCSGTDLRLGARFVWQVLPRAPVGPWVGAGVGVESLQLSQSTSSRTTEIAARGVDVQLELGADFAVAPKVRVGPFIGVSAGRYGTIAVNGTTTTDFDATIHKWLTLGVLARLDL